MQDADFWGIKFDGVCLFVRFGLGALGFASEFC